jgi:glutamine synthetase
MPHTQFTAADLVQQLSEQHHNKVKLAISDIDGILRGKIISLEKFSSAVSKGFGFCDVVFGWDAGDTAYDNARITGWQTGYPDAPARVDIETFRQIPWEDDMAFFLADFSGDNKYAASCCPRSLLKRVVNQAHSAGYLPMFSQEFEWFNFANTAQELHSARFRNIKPLTPGMFGYSVLRASQQSEYFNDLFDQLAKFDVPLEGLHTETGPGTYEAAITYAPALEAADRAILFKTGVKEIAHRHGIIASFMAKWNEQLPGCGGHVHQSLWDAQSETNLFYDASRATHMSSLMESYIAGQLFCLPQILPMYAPTINSYKRLVEGAWAPTTLTWGIDNRTAALRALPGSASSCRLETRVPGADANPYLVMAACLASGLYGIQQNMPLEVPATVGNGYTNTSNGILPRNLWDATQAMKASALAKTLFGEAFVEHFCATREWEWRQYGKAVTDWELKRYFEII